MLAIPGKIPLKQQLISININRNWIQKNTIWFCTHCEPFQPLFYSTHKDKTKEFCKYCKNKVGIQKSISNVGTQQFYYISTINNHQYTQILNIKGEVWRVLVINYELTAHQWLSAARRYLNEIQYTTKRPQSKRPNQYQLWSIGTILPYNSTIAG